MLIGIGDPGLSLRSNPGITKQQKIALTLKGFVSCATLSGFLMLIGIGDPGLSLRSNPGPQLANAFGV
jgi:hypothetical protein